METMTSKERVKKTFNCEEVDRTPIKDIIHNIPVLEYYGGEKINSENAYAVTCRALGKACDLTRAIGIPADLEVKKYRDEYGYSFQTDWWTSAIHERPFKTVEGLQEQVKREINDIRESMDNGFISPAAGLSAKLTGQDAKTREELKESFTKLVKDIDCVVVAPESIPCITQAYSRAGLDLFSYLYADNPELVREWLDTLVDHEVWRIEGIADPELMPIAMTADDIAYTQGLLFSPEFLRKELFPRFNRVNDAWLKNGSKIIFHTDGDKHLILGDILAGGPVAINPMEPNSNNLKDYRERYPRLVFTGSIDQVEMLPNGTEEEVRQAVRQSILDAGQKGIFIGSSTEVHPLCKVENVVAMYDEAINFPLKY